MKTEVVFIQGLNREITFYIGKNQNENFDVIDKGKPDDIWFHAKNISSCHVVTDIPVGSIQNKKMLYYIIKTGALLCKQNTNKLKSQTKVEISYTLCKNITKTDVPGCILTTYSKTIVC